jgi:hypothetical protein
MGAIVERRTTKLKVPLLVHEFMCALKNEDYDTCGELKEHFTNTYERFSEPLKIGFRDYLVSYLKKERIDNRKHLNGLFDIVLKKS